MSRPYYFGDGSRDAFGSPYWRNEHRTSSPPARAEAVAPAVGEAILPAAEVVPVAPTGADQAPVATRLPQADQVDAAALARLIGQVGPAAEML